MKLYDADELAAMTASKINAYVAKIDARTSKLTDRFIALGYGHIRLNDIVKLDIPEAQEYARLSEARYLARIEAELRYGPYPPTTLPSYCKPRR